MLTNIGTGSITTTPAVPSLDITDWSQHLFALRMDSVGDGTGSTDMAVDGSVSPVIFRLKPAVGHELWITKIVVMFADQGSIDSGAWGNGITMTNGIAMVLVNDGTLVPATNFNIKDVGDLASLTFNVEEHTWGSGDSVLVSRYTPGRSTQGLYLSDATNDEFQVVINDDLTGLSRQYVTCRGITRPIP